MGSIDFNTDTIPIV